VITLVIVCYISLFALCIGIVLFASLRLAGML